MNPDPNVLLTIIAELYATVWSQNQRIAELEAKLSKPKRSQRAST